MEGKESQFDLAGRISIDREDEVMASAELVGRAPPLELGCSSSFPSALETISENAFSWTNSTTAALVSRQVG
jgi:hypothetical protein